jgi:hypothetical protein
VELSERHPLFVGLKLDGTLRRQLEGLSGPDRRYVSGDDSTFLRICSRGGDLYVGKVIEEPLTTDRVDDVRRNVLSILQRLCPDTRLPGQLRIWACLPADPEI